MGLYDADSNELYVIYRSALSDKAKKVQGSGEEKHSGALILHRDNALSELTPTRLNGDYVDLDERRSAGPVHLYRMLPEQLENPDGDIYARIKQVISERQDVRKGVSDFYASLPKKPSPI